jgi:hypothetical protein
MKVMSYYTRFELKISISSVGNKTEHRKAKRLILQRLGSLGFEETGGFVFSTKSEIKWYDHE